ncbi:MAG: preprotein translocase subunit YajC [Lentisphaeria bacterium]
MLPNNFLNVFMTVGQAQGFKEMLATFFPFIILFAVLYFLFIRPEQKRAKQHRELIQKLKAGDQVVTNSGLHGTIKGVQQKTVSLNVAENTEITLDKTAVVRIEKADDQTA